MRIDLQIRASMLAEIAAKSVQNATMTACFKTVPPYYIDHVDLAPLPAKVTASHGAVRIGVPLDVYVVTRADLIAAPNGLPTGAVAPAGRVDLVLELTTLGAVLVLRCVDIDFGVTDVELAVVAAAFGLNIAEAKAGARDAIGSVARADLGTQLAELGMVVTSSRVELVEDVVAVRFNAADAAVTRLRPGQHWGIFMDGESVEELAISLLPDALLARLTIHGHWRPRADVPHVDIDFLLPELHAGPFSATVDGTFSVDITNAPPWFSWLSLTFGLSFDLHADLGPWVPGFVENALEDLAKGMVDPGAFGLPSAGDDTSVVELALPRFSFAGARFEYEGVHATAEGMLLGGSVQLGASHVTNLHTRVAAFGPPTRHTQCRNLAKSGTGDPAKTVSLAEVSTTARASLEGLGAFCGVEVVSHGSWVERFVFPPQLGVDRPSLRVTIPSLAAASITQPLQVIVRTARGARFLDFGIPPPVEVDEHFVVTNASRRHLDNCLHFLPGPLDQHKVNWGAFARDLRDPVVNPAIQLEESWSALLARGHGLEVQILTFEGLEPGELLQFRSYDHAIDLTADPQGRAVFPVVLSFDDELEPATLTRINRRSIHNRFSVRSATFRTTAVSLAAVPQPHSGAGAGLSVMGCDDEEQAAHARCRVSGAVLTRPNPDITRGVNAGGAAVSAPSALSPDRLTNSVLNVEELRGVSSVFSVPGFPDGEVAFACMNDGTVLVLNIFDRAIRVAGSYSGPIGALELSDDGAKAEHSGQVSLFHVSQVETPSCGCH